MKDVNQYRNEMAARIAAEVMQKMPELICKKWVDTRSHTTTKSLRL